MTETSKPDNAHNGLRDYFTRWIEGIETLLTERDKRYEDKFRAADEKTSLALAASDKALTKAEAATERRFESVNEFRDTLRDQAGTFITRAEVNAKNSAYDDKLEVVRKEIQFLREANRTDVGRKEVTAETHKDSQWSTGIWIAVGFSSLSFLLALVGLLYNIFK